MAEIAMRQMRLLGFAPLAEADAVLRVTEADAVLGVTGADALLAAMRAIPGPYLRMQSGPAVVALLQEEPEVPLVGRSRDELIAGLQSVQRRLEVACAAGPFLPMDPAAACGPADDMPRLLEAAWDALARAAAEQGTRQQWDIVLSWQPEPVVARNRAQIASAAVHGAEALAEAVRTVLRAECSRREAALLAVLAPAVIAFAKGGAACADAQVAVTVLVAAGGEAAVEAALDGLAAEHAEGASIDMRGPLPPVSFSPVRLATVEGAAIARAWATLGLPDRIDLSTLHRHWRLGAAEVHPDRQAGTSEARQGSGATVSDLTAAYHLLRDLLPPDAAGVTFDRVLRSAGLRLVIPTLDQAPTARVSAPLAELVTLS
jgi:hypothetical protein